MDTRGFDAGESLIIGEEGLEWCYPIPCTPPSLRNYFTPLTATGSPPSSSASSFTTPEHFLAPPSPLTPPLPLSLLIRTPPASPLPSGGTHLVGGDICPDIPRIASDDTQLGGGNVWSNTPDYECDCGCDQTDGVVSTLLIEGLKTASLHLLGIVLYQYWEEVCYGCQINHPSQKHHECFTRIPECFYVEHFDLPMKRLLTNKFVGVVRRFLTLKSISADDTKIRGVAETVLYELKSAEDATVKIREMYDLMVGDDIVKVAQILKI